MSAATSAERGTRHHEGLGASRVVVIAQARMGSTRLPGKGLVDLAGKPLVERVLERAARAESVDEVVLATTDVQADDELAAYVAGLGFRVLRGSSDDVLDRYARAADMAEADIIVRITCDCPFVEPRLIDDVVAAVSAGGVDYATNTLIRTYPIGLDVEAFTRDALTAAHAEAVQQHEREHVTPFLYQHPTRFRLCNLTAADWATHPEWRLTVDTAEDLALARFLYAGLSDCFALAEVVALVMRDPSVLETNSGVEHRHVAKPETW